VIPRGKSLFSGLKILTAGGDSTRSIETIEAEGTGEKNGVKVDVVVDKVGWVDAVLSPEMADLKYQLGLRAADNQGEAGTDAGGG
jgi:hypothetical protein